MLQVVDIETVVPNGHIQTVCNKPKCFRRNSENNVLG